MALSRAEKLRMVRESGLLDPDWYRKAYAVGPGADPAAHFLRHGAAGETDPGPGFSSRYYLATHPRAQRRGANPLLHALNHPDPQEAGLDSKAVLWAADAVAREGRPELALRLARRDLPPELAHTARILACNAALPDDALWLEHLNAYLSGAGAPGLRLGPGDSLFDRLSAALPPKVGGGPLISVLMAVHDAEATVAAAMRSVLDQSWQALELIVVDDASTDGTWPILQRLARSDSRVRLLRNRRNVGPYASKNTALQLARGDWITGQDADEWSHPTRLERHMRAVLGAGGPLRASAHTMVRMTPEGRFSQIRRIGGEVLDGVQQHCPVSVLFERDLLVRQLGSWDCARFGADKEMLGRVAAVLGAPLPTLPIWAVISLDMPGSLTNNPETGIHPDIGVTPARRAYRGAWRRWQAEGLTPGTAYFAFPPVQRRFALPEGADVPLEDILCNLETAPPSGLR